MLGKHLARYSVFRYKYFSWITSCSPELHEQAAIDGANKFQRFMNVTLPQIKGILMITSLLSIIWTFADFQLIYVLTKGGPANQTHIFGTYAYQVGLLEQKLVWVLP